MMCIAALYANPIAEMKDSIFSFDTKAIPTLIQNNFLGEGLPDGIFACKKSQFG
jgi:hypothetical protein